MDVIPCAVRIKYTSHRRFVGVCNIFHAHFENGNCNGRQHDRANERMNNEMQYAVQIEKCTARTTCKLRES